MFGLIKRTLRENLFELMLLPTQVVSQYFDLKSVIIEKNQMTYLQLTEANRKDPRYILSGTSGQPKLHTALCFVDKAQLLFNLPQRHVILRQEPRMVPTCLT